MITEDQVKEIVVANGKQPISVERIGFNVTIQGLTPPTPNSIPPVISSNAKIWYIGFLNYYQPVDALANLAFDIRIVNYNKADAALQFTANARTLNTRNFFIITDQIVLNPIDPNESALLSFDGYKVEI